MIASGDNSSLSAPSSPAEKANILLVDDQPGNLLAHESILAEMGENIFKGRTKAGIGAQTASTGMGDGFGRNQMSLKGRRCISRCKTKNKKS